MLENDLPSDLVTSIPANIENTLQIDLYTDDTKKSRSYAGYVDVNSTVSPGKKNHLFYWFFESQTCNPNVPVAAQQQLISETPLIIWLNGGPGASSLAGLFLENGPFTIGKDAAGTISATPDSWNQEAHVVYWDQPIGSGYSHADDHGEFVRDEETLSQMFWEGLQAFFSQHPEYAECPLYVCGESYAGKYVPAIALKIDEHNQKNAPGRTMINLQGLSVGNGWITPELSIRFMIDFAYTTGFIGMHQRDTLYGHYEKFQEALHRHEMKTATYRGNEIVAEVLAYGGKFDMYDARDWDGLSLGAMKEYLNTAHVKKALHVPSNIQWKCEDNEGPVAEALVEDIMADCSAEFSKLLGKKDQDVNRYRVLLYTGNFDTACGYQSTEEILTGLEWEGKADWLTAPRLIWTQAQGNPKGFVRQYRNLTQVSVPDAGHEVPAYQPQTCREMIYNWIFQRPFRGYEAQPPAPRDRSSRWKHTPQRPR